MKKKLIISVGILLIAALTLSVYLYNELFSERVRKETTFTINRGDTLNGVIRELYKMEIIGNRRLTSLYIRFLKVGFTPKAGTFTLEKGASLNEVLNIIDRGIGRLERLTIPPGLSLKEIGELLEKESVIDRAAFKKITENPEFYRKWPLIKKNSLEGFIYPETYFFSKSATPEEIVSIFVNSFFKMTSSLIDYTTVNRNTLYDLIIIASLIEEEAVVDSERPVISSVIHNRIRKKMKLQLCPTVQYAKGRHSKTIYLKDLEVDSPYNTYIHAGLPPTPICNPSAASIKAALNPAETEYLFYVSRGDGSHNFSKTYREHLNFKDGRIQQ